MQKFLSSSNAIPGAWCAPLSSGSPTQAHATGQLFSPDGIS